jgi:uncharacterized OsmC-like protein
LGPDDLFGEVEGEVGKEGKVLILRTVRVTYRLRVPEDLRETVERVHEVHAASCPVARSISPCVAIETHVAYV